MAEDQKIQQDVRVQSTNLPAPKQVSLRDRRQEEELRQQQISEIRKSYIVHGGPAA
jgi:hypothetical protein